MHTQKELEQRIEQLETKIEQYWKSQADPDSPITKLNPVQYLQQALATRPRLSDSVAWAGVQGTYLPTSEALELKLFIFSQDTMYSSDEGITDAISTYVDAVTELRDNYKLLRFNNAYQSVNELIPANAQTYLLEFYNAVKMAAEAIPAETPILIGDPAFAPNRLGENGLAFSVTVGNATDTFVVCATDTEGITVVQSGYPYFDRIIASPENYETQAERENDVHCRWAQRAFWDLVHGNNNFRFAREQERQLFNVHGILTDIIESASVIEDHRLVSITSTSTV